MWNGGDIIDSSIIPILLKLSDKVLHLPGSSFDLPSMSCSIKYEYLNSLWHIIESATFTTKGECYLLIT